MSNVAELKPNSENHAISIKVLDSSLRLSLIPLSVASLWIMVRNQQINDYGKLQFSNFTGFKYLVSINAISAGYALIAVVLSWFKGLISNWVFFVSDQVVAYLMVTSWSAVAEILYLAYNGDRAVTWSEACDSYGKFCSKARVSLILHVLAFMCLLVLSVISAYKVFSKFEPPCNPCNQEEEQAAQIDI